MQFDLHEHPHLRWNPLTESHLLVSPHRAKRPWQGQVEKSGDAKRPAHDPGCYLCAGNTRANGAVNPDYPDVYAFTNDFAALLPEKTSTAGLDRDSELFRITPERGICRVVVFSPRHDLTIPEMSTDAVRRVVDLWCAEYEALGRHRFIRAVQIFENKGAVMGCSNPHPHGQIWAQAHVPEEPAKKGRSQARYFRRHGRTLLADYLQAERIRAERLIVENEYFTTLVPFWAVWPFEAMIVPKRPMARITDMTDAEKTAFAAAYRALTIRYDNLFEVSFPYSAGIHQAPTDGRPHPEWHWHMAFYPPLLRSATVKKFMVGYEMLGNPQRDITPEKAAAVLRALPEQHYAGK